MSTPSADDAHSAEPVGAASVLLPDRTDTTALRVMKIVVIVLGIALVLGFFTVIGRMVYLTSRTDASTDAARVAGPASGAPLESALTLPAGHEVRHLSLDANRLAVHVSAPGGTPSSIAVIDLSTGRVTNRISLSPAAAKP